MVLHERSAHMGDKLSPVYDFLPAGRLVEFARMMGTSVVILIPGGLEQKAGRVYLGVAGQQIHIAHRTDAAIEGGVERQPLEHDDVDACCDQQVHYLSGLFLSDQPVRLGPVVVCGQLLPEVCRDASGPAEAAIRQGAQPVLLGESVDGFPVNGQ
jgi:hypothetical protein